MIVPSTTHLDLDHPRVPGWPEFTAARARFFALLAAQAPSAVEQPDVIGRAPQAAGQEPGDAAE